MKKTFPRKPARLSMAVALCVPILLAGIDKQLQSRVHYTPVKTHQQRAAKVVAVAHPFPEKSNPVSALNVPTVAFVHPKAGQ